MAEKLEMETKDLTQVHIAQIQSLFPNAVKEVRGEDGKIKLAIDFDVLRQELSASLIDEKQERYQMTWPDKKKSILLANQGVRATLRPVPEKSVNFETTKNIYIEGDNLDVLKVLRETYLGKVKMIYIDPPYNTGNDFIYEDDFSQTTADYDALSGHFDDQGNRLTANTDSNGRFHTDWLNMMYPRLKLAKDFLTEDGVIFISIDDNEQSGLKRMCDEIFGESNFITSMVWAAGKKNDSKFVSVSHEYILVYVKSAEYLSEHKILWREKKQGLNDIYAEYERLKKKYGNDYQSATIELKKWYRSLPGNHPAKNHSHYSHIDERGIFFPDNVSWPGGGGPKYEVLHPITHKPVKIPSRGWMFSTPQRMQQMIDEGKIYFGVDENSVPCIKSYLSEREWSTPYSVFYKDGRAATKRLRDLMGDSVFENPKDEEIIGSLISMVGTDSNSIVMDFFSGSATTAQAVFERNFMDGEQRRFILVQLPQPCAKESLAYQNGYKTICEIGEERIRRAGAKIQSEAGLLGDDLDIGFRVLRLDSTNMKDVYYNPLKAEQSLLSEDVDNIKPDRTHLDLLFQVMLDLGIELTSGIKETEIYGKKVFKIEDNYLVACFATEITDEVVREIAKLKPIYVVFRDASFADDASNINCEQIIKSISPNTELKVL